MPHLNLELMHEPNPTWESLSLQRDNLNCIDCSNITILIGYYLKYLFYQLPMYVFICLENFSQKKRNDFHFRPVYEVVSSLVFTFINFSSPIEY
jgi:hypothetical protein